jgi:hypothetical protein
VSVRAAVAKVKNLLLGLTPTAAEVKLVAADQKALDGLIAGWMQLPEYRGKMIQFFSTAFQQDGWGYGDLDYQFCTRYPFTYSREELVDNLQQSFARTVLQLIDEGKPLTSALTTTRFMLTPALMAAYAYADTLWIADRVICSPQKLPWPIKVETNRPIPIERAIDPTSPDFMTFLVSECSRSSVVLSDADTSTLASVIFSSSVSREDVQCHYSPSGQDRYILPSDFTDWKMVTVRQPTPGESTTPLYDLPTMRAGKELVLHIPRQGFFSTPAFAARWPTNVSNQHRVVLNQTLIVALGKPVDLSNKTRPLSLAALNEEHAAADDDCYACHQSLDPMRQFFQQAYSQSFSEQTDPAKAAVPGEFAFHGVIAEGKSIYDLGPLLASHPLFAPAWVQKLCTWAASGPCDEDDPEFIRLTRLFRDSGYSWNALVRSLFASPLVTYLQSTQTATNQGERISIARQVHLCAALSVRLGEIDVCGLGAAPAREEDEYSRPLPQQTSRCEQSVIPTVCRWGLAIFGVDEPRQQRAPASATLAMRRLTTSWPSDQFGRGDSAPSLVASPSLLTRGGQENLCARVAEKVVDVSPLFPSTAPDTAIGNLVTRLMGLATEDASVPAQVLKDHFAAAEARGATPAIALQSTFVVACLSPYVAGIGE